MTGILTHAIHIISALVLLVSFIAAEVSLNAEPQKKVADETEAKREQSDEPEAGIRGWIKKRLEPSDRRPKDGFSLTGGIIVAGSSLAGGGGYRRLDLANSGIGFEASGMVSIRRYQEYGFAIGLIGNRDSTLEFDTADTASASLFNESSRKAPGSSVFLDVRYRDYPRHTFYGMGIDSRKEDRADYALTGTSVEGVWQWQMSPTLGMSARGGLLDLNVGVGRNTAILNIEDRFNLSTMPGAIEQPRYMTFGVGLVHDRRHQPGAPEDGTLIGVSLRRFAASEPDLSFTRFTADARAYHPLASRGVLALRGLVSTDFTGDSGATPFYLQQSLGGGETLRGFHSYRFRDQSLAHATAEYRMRVHRYVELAPFVDAGTVAPGLSRLALGSFTASYGVGIRARTDRLSLARLDWAWGTDGYRVAIGTGPVF